MAPSLALTIADHEVVPEGLRFLSIPSVFQDELKVDAAVIERTLAAERALEAFWNGEPITESELIDDVRLLVDTSPMHRISAPVDGPRIELPTGTGLQCVALIRTIDGASTAMPDSCAPWLGPNSSRLLADDGRTLAHDLTHIDEPDSTGRRHIAAEFGHGTMVRAAFERTGVNGTLTLFDVDGDAAALERELWRATRTALVFDELTPGLKRLRVESQLFEGCSIEMEKDFEVGAGTCLELQIPGTQDVRAKFALDCRGASRSAIDAALADGRAPFVVELRRVEPIDGWSVSAHVRPTRTEFGVWGLPEGRYEARVRSGSLPGDEPRDSAESPIALLDAEDVHFQIGRTETEVTIAVTLASTKEAEPPQRESR